MPPVLEVRDITKRFPGVLANDHVSFTLEPGEIHAFLGENGAGKSTLMNILYGLYDPDEGQIFINGKQVTISGPNDAIRRGLGMVHQHFMLVPTLTVAENVMLGTEITSGFLLDERTANARIRELSTQYGLDVPPEALILDLPVGVQQRVEIVKALYRGADILILDEPTAVLTPQEADDLFKVIRTLVAQGKSIIFISHKLKEVLRDRRSNHRPSARPRGRQRRPGHRNRGATGGDDGRARGRVDRRQGRRRARRDRARRARPGGARRPPLGRRRSPFAPGVRRRGAGDRRGAGQRPDRAG